MTQDDQQWDPSTPGFVPAVLKTIVGLGVLVTAGGTLILTKGFWGFLSGSALAVALFLSAMRAGSVLRRTGNLARTMLWLLLSQFLLWVGMALLLIWARVNPVGFIIGVSVLPVSVVLALGWYTWRRKRLPS